MLFDDDFDRVERVFRQIGGRVTIGSEPCPTYLSGELWTIHTHDDGLLGMGQGGTLFAAYQDLHKVSAPKREAA
ncbi:hypothetical protein [Sphingomonas immobilis]|uniref:Uncharacterized protein n=1 Tax=Sphingomonas immobilis TaxID=3063997 RepID=A0ABT8ZU69_9SPHN|nr:hypothetical protein [Sphingomonas sp. CA1-15]MDO7841109.1 hypothetical protein [Sphingomonas sp. CA1-15]